MNTNDLLYGEREIYSSRVERFTDDGYKYIFCEELVDYTLKPYRGGLNAIPGFSDACEKFEEAYILYRILWSVDYRKVPCILLKSDKKIYISEKNFNKYWGEISGCIYKGIIEIAGCQIDKIKSIGSPEKIVDLTFYDSDTTMAEIKNNKIAIIGRKPDASLQELESKRKSAMDNRHNIYVYSSVDNVYHDKSCELADKILDKNFNASETIPKGRTICRRCQKRVYIRKAVGDDFKRYAAYERIFEDSGVSIENIRKLVMDYNARFHLEDTNVLAVECAEDTWKIIIKPNNRLELKHNNYVMVSEYERYICGGFHLQKHYPYTMTGIIRYIESYNWQRHLEAKAKENEAESSTDIKEENVQALIQFEKEDQIVSEEVEEAAATCESDVYEEKSDEIADKAADVNKDINIDMNIDVEDTDYRLSGLYTAFAKIKKLFGIKNGL